MKVRSPAETPLMPSFLASASAIKAILDALTFSSSSHPCPIVIFSYISNRNLPKGPSKHPWAQKVRLWRGTWAELGPSFLLFFMWNSALINVLKLRMNLIVSTMKRSEMTTSRESRVSEDLGQISKQHQPASSPMLEIFPCSFQPKNLLLESTWNFHITGLCNHLDEIQHACFSLQQLMSKGKLSQFASKFSKTAYKITFPHKNYQAANLNHIDEPGTCLEEELIVGM